MANPPLQSPTNPHFFQPLSPGHDTHLIIPVAFFSKYIEGKNEQKSAKLRSDASDNTWEVKIGGRRFTEGWKDFATAHDLRIGDIIIFKHEGDMMFSVTPLGPSCCEIQYAQSQIIKEEEIDNSHDDDDDNEKQHEIRKVLKTKILKPKTERKSSFSFDYCFIAEVTASNLKVDTLYLPVEAASSNALNKRCHEMIVVNKEGKSWTVKLKFREPGGRYYIRGGWRRFCLDNRRKVGDLITFNLVGDGETTPMICICPEEECLELMSRERGSKKAKRRPNLVASSSLRKNQFVTIPSFSHVTISKAPNFFTNDNGISKHKKIILMDKHGARWLTNQVKDGPNYGRRGLGKGWKHVCEANDVLKIGQPFVSEFMWKDTMPVLKFCSKVKIETICD